MGKSRRCWSRAFCWYSGPMVLGIALAQPRLPMRIKRSMASSFCRCHSTVNVLHICRTATTAIKSQKRCKQSPWSLLMKRGHKWVSGKTGKICLRKGSFFISLVHYHRLENRSTIQLHAPSVTETSSIAIYTLFWSGATARNNTMKKLSTLRKVTCARIQVAGLGELRITLTLPGRPL